MELKFICTTKCPECGCTVVVAESIETITYNYGSVTEIREHTNTGRWETRKFLCGKTIRYSPNFSIDETIHECMVTEAYKYKQQRIQRLKNHIKVAETKLAKLINS